MDVAGTVVNAAIVAMVGLVLGWLGKGRFEAIDRGFEAQERRIDRLEERVEHRIDGLEHRMDAMAASLDAMRSDLTRVALAVGVRPRAENA